MKPRRAWKGRFIRSVKRGERRSTLHGDRGEMAAPFTTSNLQQEASRKLGFTTAKTMQVAQQLYEGVDIESSGRGTLGLISYHPKLPDSVRLSDEAVAAARDDFRALRRAVRTRKAERIQGTQERTGRARSHSPDEPRTASGGYQGVADARINTTSIGWSICALSPARWRMRCMKPSRLKSLRIRALCFAQVPSGSSLPALPPSMRRARTTRRIRMNTAAA